MAIHTSLYFQAVALKVTPTYEPVGAVVDQVLGYRNAAHVPGKPMSLVALAATGLNATLGLSGARVQSPKTLVSPVYVRPVNATANFDDNPNVSCFVDKPVMMRAGEEISASAEVTGTGTTADVAIVA